MRMPRITSYVTGRAPATAPLLTVGAAAALLLTATTGAVLAPSPAGAQQLVAEMEPEVARAADFELSIANIMRGFEHVGKSPESVRWSDDSRWIYFQWLPGGNDWDADRELYRVSAEGGEPEMLTEEQADSLGPLIQGGDLSSDRRLRVTSWRGDIYVVDRGSLDVRRLTETVESEGSPSFSADGRRVFFTRDGNLYSLGLEDDGIIRQLTDIRQGPAPQDEAEAQGHRKFLEEQQEELFEHVRREKREQEEREARQDRIEDSRPETVYLGQRERVRSLDPNADGTYVTVTTFTPASESKTVPVPDWVTASGYTEDISTRSKVGDDQGTVRMGLLETATGEIQWLDLTPDGDEGDEGEGETEAEDESAMRDSDEPELFNQTGFVAWNDAGTLGLIQAISYDYKTRWFWTLDAATGELTLLDELHDEAWVGGPCFGGFGGGCAGWIPESNRAYFVSEATGYAHLYTINGDGTDPRQLTAGQWEVRDVSIPEDGSAFHLHTGEISPFGRHFYRMDFDGRNKELITEGDGRYSATPSPDGERLAVLHDRANRPPELYVGDNEAATELEQVTVSPTADWLTFGWIEPEIVHFEAEDGTMVPARIYRPSDVGAEPSGAGVIFVHGAGYLQNVSHGWSGYFREYMFHHYLAANGYTVLDIDYRGSAGYGRDWRVGIYRWMGGKDLSDQVDGARYLVAQEGVDADRIGIYGGSYGGFITLMALFTGGETFKAGAALRSVTDWAHYNHWYTSRILNEPQDDEEAYEQSSPIYFAENFRPDQHLVMLHGMVDTNVHFSDVVRLAQRLIELGKENWEMAVYPVENHGFVEPTSWTDEYRRIFELFDTTVGQGVTVEGHADMEAGMPGGG